MAVVAAAEAAAEAAVAAAVAGAGVGVRPRSLGASQTSARSSAPRGPGSAAAR